MSSVTYRVPAELNEKLDSSRGYYIQPPADDFLHDGKLNMGPAILLAAALSAGCFAGIFSLGYRLFH
jgi:hypothetical protein